MMNMTQVREAVRVQVGGDGSRKRPATQAVRRERHKCWEYERTGTCRWGAGCRYAHDRGPSTPRNQYADTSASASANANPGSAPPAASAVDERPSNRRPAKGVCFRWQKEGVCKWGANCKFEHDPKYAK